MARKRGASYNMRVHLPNPAQVKEKLGVNELGYVQQAVTDEIKKRLPAYIPKMSGELRSSLRAVKPTQLQIRTPYARYMFFGKTKSGRPINYSLRGGPKVGAHWDKRLVANEGRDIVATVRKKIRKR